MNIRAKTFWFIDRLKGGKVRSYCNEINRCLNDGKSGDNLQLKKILEWAVNNTSFYAKYSSFRSLRDFPIIDKSIIRENTDDMIAIGFDKNQMFKQITSGSTGTPLVTYQDPQKRLRARADTIVFSDIAGYHLGTKLYYSRVWNEANYKSKLQCITENIVMQDSSNLGEDALNEFIKQLEEDRSEKSVLVFASSLSALYYHMKKYNITTSARVNCFITMSESLPNEVKHGIEKIFKTNVISRYSNVECGIMAQQMPGKDEYVINTSSFHIELLKLDSDESVEDGKVGRIVVTDLYNKGMPIIRYDTGDCGIITRSSEGGKEKTIFTRIDGRIVDCIYSTSGDMLSPVIVINTMWKYTDIKQFQFIQNGKKDYLLKLNLDGEEEYGKIDNLLMDLKEYTGDDAIIDVEYVNEIPLLASGKRKQVINNYKK
jgi:phenylacetate-CoA ligase